MDGQWVGLLAAAVDDCNAMAVQAYNAFSPSTAQGVGLSSVIKLNGLQRLVPTFSNAVMMVGGQARKVIVNGVVNDDNGNPWSLFPASIVIPDAGQIAVFAICQTPGAIEAPSGTINTIANSQPGWQTAVNTGAATPGSPVETDAALRFRQALSTMDASTAMLEGVVGAVAALPGVARVAGYANTTDEPDPNGAPGNTLVLTVDGGDPAAICNTIWRKKGGCGTFGSVTEVIVDQYDVPTTIAYSPVVEVRIKASLVLKQFQAFNSDVPGQIKAALVAAFNGAGIGVSLQLNRLYQAAYLNGAPNGFTYEITSFKLARGNTDPFAAADIPIAFDEAAHGYLVDVLIASAP